MGFLFISCHSLLFLFTAIMLRTVFYDALFTAQYFDESEPSQTFCLRICFCISGPAKYENPDVHDKEQDPESSMPEDPFELFEGKGKKVGDNSNIDSEVFDDGNDITAVSQPSARNGPLSARIKSNV
jgi:hypothetical protein